MASETEYGNFSAIEETLIKDAVLSYTSAVITLPFVNRKTLEGDSKTGEFDVHGTVSGAIVAESSAASKSELTDTKVSMTAAKAMVWSESTGESVVYLGERPRQRLATEAGKGLGVLADTTVLALASSVTNTAGTTLTALDEDAIIQASYLLGGGNATGIATSFINELGRKQLRTAFKDNAAVGFNSIAQSGLENGQLGSYAGKLYNINFFANNSVYTDATDYFGLIFTPEAIGFVEANGGLISFMETPVPSKHSFEYSWAYFFAAGIVKQAGVARLRFA